MILCPDHFQNEMCCFQRNITYITNPRVRDIMLNMTWTALVPKLQDFEDKDYEQWFSIFLIYLIPSFTSEQLEHIPANITCESYAAM